MKLCGKVFERQCVMRGQRSFQVIGRINLENRSGHRRRIRASDLRKMSKRWSAGSVFPLERTRSPNAGRIPAWGRAESRCRLNSRLNACGAPMQVVFQLEGRAEP